MKRGHWRVGIAAAAFAVAGTGGARAGWAQNPQPVSPSDSGAAQAADQAQQPGPMGGPRAEELRALIQERFAQRVKEQLGLSDEQMDKLRTAVRADRDRRLQIRDREQDLRRALADQMRPGVAANQDSVARLLTGLATNHVARDQLEQQEQRELAQFLTPVQRAQLLQMQQQLQRRIQTIREGGGGGGGRMGPPPVRQGPMRGGGPAPRVRRPGPGRL